MLFEERSALHHKAQTQSHGLLVVAGTPSPILGRARRQAARLQCPRAIGASRAIGESAEASLLRSRMFRRGAIR